MIVYKNNSFSFRLKQTFFNFFEATDSSSGFSLRACLGQILTQCIQEIHLLLSVTLGLSVGIAFTGHSFAHNPQELQDFVA